MKIGSFAVVSCPTTGRFLMGRRRSDNLWCFFGGNRKGKKELPAITLIREFHEETGISLQTIEYAAKIENEKRTVWIYEVDLYETAVISLSKEHEACLWWEWNELKHMQPEKMNTPTQLIMQKLKGWYK